jgi:hypothetical protein
MQKRGTPDAELFIRVLCHRADHPASKFLKKEYKIPKKLPLITLTGSKPRSPAFGVFY